MINATTRAIFVSLLALVSATSQSQDNTPDYRKYQNSKSTWFGIGSGFRGRGALFGGARQGKVGVQFGLVNNIDINPFRFSLTTIPVGAVNIGRFRTVPNSTLDLLYFPGNEEESIFLGLGLGFETRSNVFRDPQSGRLYNGGDAALRIRSSFSIGFMGESNGANSLGVQYHTQLGWAMFFANKR